MAKAFSLASWNVEHFKGEQQRLTRIVNFLSQVSPDLFGIYEVEGGEVFEKIRSAFPNYSFQITEGPQTQEILVGWRNGVSVFLTQKITFKAGSNYMRPGALATVTASGVNYAVLFLHLASSTAPKGFGLRDEMVSKALKFRKTLDKAPGANGNSNYMFVGDLNSMGMEYPYDFDIDPATELRRWDGKASQYYGMKRLTKTHPNTWSNGSTSSYPPSNLDHVYAADHLQFKQFKDAANADVDVSVRGWAEKSTVSAQDTWIGKYSDHCLLYLEVQKV